MHFVRGESAELCVCKPENNFQKFGPTFLHKTGRLALVVSLLCYVLQASRLLAFRKISLSLLSWWRSVCHYILLFKGDMGIELEVSYFHDKHLYSLSYFSGPGGWDFLKSLKARDHGQGPFLLLRFFPLSNAVFRTSALTWEAEAKHREQQVKWTSENWLLLVQRWVRKCEIEASGRNALSTLPYKPSWPASAHRPALYLRENL